MRMAVSMRILLIEGQPSSFGTLGQVLRRHGHSTRVATSGFDGLRLATADRFDAILLDLDLTDLGGLAVLRMLRAVSDVAVIAMAASDESLVETMNAGADDVVVRPCTAEQLEARLQAVRDRPGVVGGRVMQIGALCIDPVSRVARLGDEELELTRKEFDVLAYLAGRTGEVVSKRELAAQVWRDPVGRCDRTVEVHLSWLRHKLGESAAEPRYLRTLRGVGVKLVDPGAARPGREPSGR